MVPGVTPGASQIARFPLFGTRTVSLSGGRRELLDLEIIAGATTFSATGTSSATLDASRRASVGPGQAYFQRPQGVLGDVHLEAAEVAVLGGGYLEFGDGATLRATSTSVANHPTQATELVFQDNATASIGDLRIADSATAGRESVVTVYAGSTVVATSASVGPSSVSGQEGVLQVLGGTFTSSGTISVGTSMATGMVSVSSGGTLSAAQITAGPAGQLINNGGQFQFSGQNTISGGQYTELSSASSWTWTGSASLGLSSAAAVSLKQSLAQFPNTTASGGSTISSTGAVRFAGPTSSLNSSTVSATEGIRIGGAAGVAMNLLGASRLEGDVAIEQSAVVQVVSGTSVFAGDVTTSGSGRIGVSSGAAATFEEDFTAQLPSSPASAGAWTFQQSVGNGSALGASNFGSGQTTLAPTSTLLVDIQGRTAALYDSIVGKTFQLGGTLRVSSTPGVLATLAAGDRFRIVRTDGFTGGQVQGTFSAVELPALAGALEWQVEYLPTEVGLRVVGSLAGDYSGNGTVDAADYTIWRDSLGQTGGGLAADGDGNGTVNAADLSIWRNNFGAAAASLPGQAVPESGGFLGGLLAWMMTLPGLLKNRLVVRIRACG